MKDGFLLAESIIRSTSSVWQPSMKHGLSLGLLMNDGGDKALVAFWLNKDTGFISRWPHQWHQRHMFWTRRRWTMENKQAHSRSCHVGLGTFIHQRLWLRACIFWCLTRPWCLFIHSCIAAWTACIKQFYRHSQALFSPEALPRQ